MNLAQRALKVVNAAVVPALKAPIIGSKLSESMALVTYTGRKSGKRVQLPVNYFRKGDDTIIIGVLKPELKSWWRNFHPTPQPIQLTIGEQILTGSAIAEQHQKFGTRIKVDIGG